MSRIGSTGGGSSSSSVGSNRSSGSSSSSSQQQQQLQPSRDAAVAYAFGSSGSTGGSARTLISTKQIQGNSSSSSYSGGGFGGRIELLAPSGGGGGGGGGSVRSSYGSSGGGGSGSSSSSSSVKGALQQQSSNFGKRSSATSGVGSSRMISGGGGGGGGILRQTVSTSNVGPEPMPNVDNDDYQLSIDDERGRGGDISRNRKKAKISFSIGDLVLSTTVGTGTFGRVRVVQFKPTRDWYALKIMKKSEILRLSQLDHILSEVKILSTTSHPFIVNLLGMQFDEKRLYLLFEYVPGGELFSYLRREGKFSESSSQFYAAEILLAFEHLHKSKIVYRDLKPENLLLTNKGHIKITDFGFAKVVQDRTYTLCGTPEYLAPEIIQSKGHDTGVDWWALGILIFEMLAGFPPFFDESAYGIYQKILAGKIEWPRHFSSDAKDLVKRLLTSDKSRRLGCQAGGAQDIKDHPWFSKISWSDLVNLKTPAPFVPKVKDANDTSNFDSYPDSDGETAGSLSSSDSRLFIDIESAFDYEE